MRRAGTDLRRLLLVLWLPWVTACGSDEVAPPADVPPPRSLHVEVANQAGGASLLTLNGVPIEVSRDVSLTLPADVHLEIHEDGRPVVDTHDAPEVLVDGQVLDVVDGRLFLAGHDLGPVDARSDVTVHGSGVVTIESFELSFEIRFEPP